MSRILQKTTTRLHADSWFVLEIFQFCIAIPSYRASSYMEDFGNRTTTCSVMCSTAVGVLNIGNDSAEPCCRFEGLLYEQQQ